MRLTADGKIKPCLFSDTEYDIRSALRKGSEEEVLSVFKAALFHKPSGHEHRVGTRRMMSQVGRLKWKLVPVPIPHPKENHMTQQLTHIDAEGDARMVDVSEKAETKRTAIAEGFVAMRPETLAVIQSGSAKKGDVLAAARIAGIMAAKQTSNLIPLCHPVGSH